MLKLEVQRLIRFQLFLLINILHNSYRVSKRATALLPNHYRGFRVLGFWDFSSISPHPTEKAPAIDRPDRWSGIWVRVVKDTDYPPLQTNNYDEHQ
jgi:hypothetical protein